MPRIIELLEDIVTPEVFDLDDDLPPFVKRKVQQPDNERLRLLGSHSMEGLYADAA